MYTSTFVKTITHSNQGNSSKPVIFSSGQTINLEGNTRVVCAFSLPTNQDVHKGIVTSTDDKFFSARATNANGTIIVKNDNHDTDLFSLDSSNGYGIIFYYDTGASQYKCSDARYSYFSEATLHFSGIGTTSTPSISLEILKNA